jgi:hypothetical protein
LFFLLVGYTKYRFLWEVAQRATTRGLIEPMKEKLVQIKIRKRLDPLPDEIESSLSRNNEFAVTEGYFGVCKHQPTVSCSWL